MKIRVLKIDQFKLGLISGIMMAGLSLLVWPIFLITFSMQPDNILADQPFFMIFIFILPVFYFIAGSLGTIIMFSIFNFVSKKMKGFDVDVLDYTDESQPVMQQETV